MKFKKIPLDELQKPKDGYIVLMDKWWSITKENKALIYISNGTYMPQCNSSESIVIRLGGEERIATFIEFAYVSPEYYIY